MLIRFFNAFLPFSTNILKKIQVVLLDHDISHHVLNCSALRHGVHFGIINIDVGGDIMIVLFFETWCVPMIGLLPLEDWV